MRRLLGLLPLAVLSLACAPRQAQTVAGPAPQQPPLVDPSRRVGKPLVLVAMPDSASFRSVRHALVDEIKKDFDVVTHIVDGKTTLPDFTFELDSTRPTCVVLMDNPTVRLFRAYQKSHKGLSPAALVVMASFLEEVRGDLANASGVAYEVPGVTAFVNLRSVVERPINRVGVVHRPSFRRFMSRQQALAAKEQVKIIAEEVPAEASASDVRNALARLRSAGIDALWVLNDNALLRDAQFLEAAWRPEIAALGVPVVVGVPTLVSAEARFGTFAVLPDLEALGVQAANVLFEISENDWRASDHAVELPVSTTTVVNMRQVREHFGLREGANRRIDKAIE
jgi:hypothetical protein